MDMFTFDHVSGKHLSTGDAHIYYELTGSEGQPALLLLHGGFGTIEDFNSLIPELSQKYRIVGIDSRGHGKSALGSGRLTYRQLQKDAEQVLSHLHINSLSIIGFSDGGVVAYRLAAQNSLNIEKLVTIGADWHYKNTEPVRELFLNITPESLKQKFPESYAAYQRLNPEPDFEAFTEAVKGMWLDAGPSGYPNETVEKIACPLLIVRGDEDHLFPAKAAAGLSELVPGSKLLNIPFAGHVAFEDQKAPFMKSLKEFLKF